MDLELDLRHAKVDVNDNATLLDVICICNDPSLDMQEVTIDKEKARHTGLGLGRKRVHLSALNGPFTMRYWFSDQPCFLRPQPRKAMRFLASLARWQKSSVPKCTLQLAKSPKSIGFAIKQAVAKRISQVSPILQEKISPETTASQNSQRKVRSSR